MTNNLLENLNQEQLQAVTHLGAPLMIIAGAGTGKTTVISQRIAWLIEQGHAKPDEVLALTFTEKAATEMEERVDLLLPIGYVDLWISTFHSFCERILREHALEIGLPHEFELVDEVGALLLMRRNFDRFELDYYRPRGNPTRFLKAILQHISRVKDELVTPEQYLDFAGSLQQDADSAEGVASADDGAEILEAKRINELASAYHTYQQILLENNALDFADLVAYTIELFQKRSNILRQYQAQFKFILVDEFQDTNSAQYELIKLLATAQNQITVVGDDDQSIYRFRGASLSNIMQFRQDFPSATNIVLRKNYRSSAAVLKHSYDLIQKNNPHRLEVQENINKELEVQVDFTGQVEHYHCATIADEVKKVLEKIVELKNQTEAAWSDFAILVRANSSAEPFIAALDRHNIPYRFLAMSGLYTRPLILDVLAWLRVIDLAHDSPSWYRLLSQPELGIAELDIAELSLYSRRKGKSLFEAVQARGQIHNLTPESQDRLHEILQSLSRLAEVARQKPAGELFVEVMKESGLLGTINQLDEAGQKEQYALLQQFYERIRRFEAASDDKSLHNFLAEFEHEREAGEVGALSNDIEIGPDVVNIMTVHGAKGLEFRYVFIVNLVEQRFPSTRRAEAIAFPEGLIDFGGREADDHIAEERRLFYVALTRAKESAFLLSADDYGGARKRKPSRFLAEMDVIHNNSQILKNIGVSDQSSQTSQASTQITPPKSISFTQIAAFTSCPRQYKYAHILKVPVFGRHSLSFGKSMHNTLHKFMAEILARQIKPQASLFEQGEAEPVKLPDQKELLKFYEESWIDEWYPDDHLRKEYFDSGRESLLDYYHELERDLPEVAFLEKGFSLKIGGVTMRGRIDRIDKLEDGFEIIDYKTGKAKQKLTWEDKRQLVLYQIAAETCFDPPLKINKLTFHYLEDNSRLSFEASVKDKEKLETQIIDTVERITKSNFEAKPGFQCQYCDFRDICEFSQS